MGEGLRELGGTDHAVAALRSAAATAGAEIRHGWPCAAGNLLRPPPQSVSVRSSAAARCAPRSITAELLAAQLRDRGDRPVHLTREPSGTPLGRLLRSSETVLHGRPLARAIAADRYAHLNATSFRS